MNIKLSKKEVVGLIYILFLAINSGFELTYINIYGPIKDISTYTLIAVFVFYNIYFRHNKNVLYGSVVYAIIASLVYFSSGETLFLFLGISAYIFYDVELRFSFGSFFVLRLLIFCVAVLYGLASSKGMSAVQVYKGGRGLISAYSFGYIHPNSFAVSIFVILALYIVANERKIRKKKVLPFLLLIILTEVITQSRSFLYLSIIYILFLFLYKRNTERANKILAIFSYASFALSIVFFLFSYFYTSLSGMSRTIAFRLNGIISSRFSHAYDLFNTYPITLFGKQIDNKFLEKATGYGVVDNGYAFSFINFGIIGFATILILNFFTIKELIKREKYLYLLVFVCFLLLGNIENTVRSMYMSFGNLFWGYGMIYIVDTLSLKHLKRMKHREKKHFSNNECKI